VLPGTNPEVQTREGVVQFVDMDNPTDSIFVNTTAVFDSALAKLNVGGFDIAATIETDTAAQFNLVVDELTGDVLSARGRADLAAGIDKSGKLSLTGNFELNSGSYQLSFNFLKRRFDILRGSTITWTGDPTSAVINVTAQYVANTSSINLVEPQLQGRATAEINRYKQRIPFNVMLYLNGELMKPVISFDIVMEEGYASAWKEVEDKLVQIRRDQAELNKQVFALLLLGRFVQENPLQDAGGSVHLASIARQSVSRLLSDQLNQWASGLIHGLDLNFGVQSIEDYSSGELQNRTDLTVAVTKRLINDRLRVTIGSNFELEGPSNSKSSTSGFASDIAIDYLLTQDGRYMIRAYRRNIYEVVVEGQVVETGLRFIISMDYDHFKELFHRRKKAEPTLPPRRSTKSTEQVPTVPSDPNAKPTPEKKP
jgi:hypothetical protein